MTKEIYFSIKEASEILGVTPLTLRNWDKSGKFPAHRHPMNNYRVYKLTALEKIISDIEGSISVNASANLIKRLSVKHLED